MNGLRSPDIPAHVSYGIVLIVGTLVAWGSVNKLLAEQRDRWAYAPTWGLVAGYALLPVALFWFLDYNGVVSDTSLFSALVTALAYQQIFSGTVEGMRMPGQTAAVWRVFEQWAKLVQHRIERLTQMRLARFTEALVTRVSSVDTTLQKLRDLATERTKKPAELAAAIAASGTTAAERRSLVRLLWDDLRMSEPDSHGDLLQRAGLIDRRTYWLSFRNGRSVVMSVVVIGMVIGIGFPIYRWSVPSHGDYWLAWQQWRYVRPTATAADEFRNRKELLAKLNTKDLGPGLARSLAEELTRRDVSVDSAQRILDFLLFSHNETVTPFFAPELVASLRTPNPDVRLRIHRTLKELQVVQFSTVLLAGEFDSLDKWVPAKEDSAGTIDGHIQTWMRWWTITQQPPKPSEAETKG